MPIFVLVFYCRNFKTLDDEKFTKKYGSAYDGLKTTRRSAIFFPFFFLMRRTAISCMAFWLDRPEIFIFIMMLLTIIETVYLLVFKPFEERLLQRLELFNEFTSIMLLYATLCFTEYIYNDTAKSHIGWVFVGGMAVNMSVHLFFMVRGSCQDCKKKMRRRKMKRTAPVKKKEIVEDALEAEMSDKKPIREGLPRHAILKEQLEEIKSVGAIQEEEEGSSEVEYDEEEGESEKTEKL